MDSTIKKFKEKKGSVAIIGLGYVGLPLAIEFAKAGFKTSGIDIDHEKVSAINKGESYITDITNKEISDIIACGNFKAYTDFSILNEVDAISICVPTPLRKTKDPDISYIVNATNEIKKYFRKGQLIVLESTTYPGTTDEVILTELSSTGLIAGKDFFLAFSPERIDPGNKIYKTKNTPKIIGGVTEACRNTAVALYENIIEKVIPVSSTKAAEMVKLLENTFRAVNIGLVNEIALICDRLDINVWEVIDAASTKPFGFMPFYPGPGLGGHCIPIDPHYLAWKLKTVNYKARFIELADDINMNMPAYVVSKVSDGLNNHGKSIKNSNILILGISYKKDINDIRESPSLDIIKFLVQKGANIFYNDPYISPESLHILEEHIDGHKGLKFVEIGEALLKQMDCTVISTDHTVYNFKTIVEHSKLVVDTRNATKNITNSKGNIITL